MRFVFHPQALQEYKKATRYYSKISSQLLKSFIQSVESGIKKILEYPEGWQIVEDDVRRHLIKQFPFGIYYIIEGDYIHIMAVMHMNREPDYWKDRLS
jgi:toxin ParE1/3/4